MQLKCFSLLFPFQQSPLYELQKPDKLINTAGTKHIQTNTIYTYLNQRLSEMILTTFAVCTNYDRCTNHLQTSQQFVKRMHIVFMKFCVLTTLKISNNITIFRTKLYATPRPLASEGKAGNFVSSGF